MRSEIRLFLPVFIFILLASHPLRAVEPNNTGRYLIPELQSGFAEENYEVLVSQKLLRGVQNFFLSPLEVPQGVKAEIGFRREEYLPVGIESVFIGVFKGGMNGVKRMAVGFFEFFTCVYPQDPILPEMSEWVY